MSLLKYIQAPFGLDRRDSAIRKAGDGILYELENMMIDEGSLKTRPGLIRQNATVLETNIRVLALHRFLGTDQNSGAEISEFYAAISSMIKKYSGGTWANMLLPPGLTLTSDQKGVFQQLRDRTYYSNYKEPVLMIKREDNQVYEAGIPEADRELIINNCESLTIASIQEEGNAPTGWGAGEWTIFTDGDTDDVTCELDYAFDHHTKGDYGIRFEQAGSGDRLKAVYDIGAITPLDWFFETQSGTAGPGTSGIILVHTAAFTTDRIIGQQIKNISDGSMAVVMERLSVNSIKTSVLTGGTLNTWNDGHQYKIGEPSSENDYIALDIFRYTKNDIDEVAIEFSSVPPNNSGNFTKGFRVVLYTDTGFEHWNMRQRTMLAEWAMNPASNRLFLAKFRKRWFLNLNDGDVDEWSLIRYMKIHLQQNSDSDLAGSARIVVDNIRLLKTPPMPAELSLQVATCDAIETWTNATNDYARATQGVSCKAIAAGSTSVYNFTGVKDLSEYSEGTPVDGSDVFIFDVCGTGSAQAGNIVITITLTDTLNRIAIGLFTPLQDFSDLQQRSIHVQEFAEVDNFDWSNVKRLTIANPAIQGYPVLYIDNIRIQPPSASKVINNFKPWDIILASAIERGVDHFFGNNEIVDQITDILFHSYVSWTRQATGQGSFAFPEMKHGRYKYGDYAAPSLQMTADPGGTFSMTFIQNDDLTQYNDLVFNLDAFFHPREYNDQYFLGTDWVEIPATDSDELSIWMSAEDISALNKIIFRFYVNANATWTVNSGSAEGTLGSNVKVLKATGGFDFRTKLGQRIKNETTGKWGIIGWVGLTVGTKSQCSAWGVTWSANDVFTCGAWSFGGAGVKPVPDNDDYYEYTIDIKSYFGKLNSVLTKSTRKALAKYPVENAETIEAYRTLLKEDGITQLQKEESGGGWWSGVISWKRSDMVHKTPIDKPFSSMQSIAAHQIIIQANSKKSATINFQDWIMRKKGAVKGDVAYKIKLMDDQGYVGAASLSSEVLATTGNDVNLADIYVPYDTRIVRKEIYRSDVTGTFRYLDTIDRLQSSYLDQITEDLLGAPIDPDFFRPPKSKIVEKAINRMAYANIIDRDNRIRKSRIQLAQPFAPHLCSDDDTFDVLPEDGQEITGFRWYNGIYIVWKEKSLYTVDPDTFEYIPREATFGLIAPESLYEIPGVGFGWLSHEGPIFGDHTNFDKFTGRLIWDDLKGFSLAVLRKAVGFYYDDYYYLFVGSTNQYGYALHVPTKSWFYLSGWNVQCVSLWNAGGDNREVYAGSAYGYVNQLFQGNTDLTDNGSSTVTQISWAIRTLDYDFERPGNYKYPRWTLMHIKNLVSGVGNEANIIVTPQLDQVAGSAYTTLTPNRTTYYQYQAEGRAPTIGGEKGSLIAMRIAGTRRCAIRDIFLEVGDLGFRPNLC